MKCEITNWKLKEIISFVDIIDFNSSRFTIVKLNDLNIPISEVYTGIIRNETIIDWSKLTNHFSFYFDKIGWEEKIKNAFKASMLSKYEYLIITYRFEGLTVKIPINIFLDDWDGFFASAHYETIIFSDDYKLIMEVSRDYFLHSNFEIM